jgi:hypothetical protein
MSDTDSMSGTDSSADFRTPDDAKTAHEDELLDEQVTGASVGPIDEGDMAAAEGLSVTPEVAESYEESLERGAAQKGEGAPEVP